MVWHDTKSIFEKQGNANFLGILCTWSLEYRPATYTVSEGKRVKNGLKGYTETRSLLDVDKCDISIPA